MKNYLNFIRNFLIDPDRKNISSIISDLYKLRNKGSIHYFTSLMYKKNAGDLKNYLSRPQLLNIIKIVYRNDGAHPILQNKNKFREYMTDNNVSISKSFGQIVNKKLTIFSNGEKYDIGTVEDLKNILNKQLSEGVFIKQVDGEGGKAVFKYHPSTGNSHLTINLDNDYIIEYEIIQHNALKEINPHCVNTLRVITINNNREVRVPDAFLRMGTGNSHVDNGSSGGIFANYDIYDNKLDKVAYKLIGSGGESFYHHPTTKIELNGIKLPYPEKVLELVKKAALLFPDKLIIGWDVVYTEDGPLLLEGNDNSHIGMMQISAKGLLSNSLYKEVFTDYLN